MIGPVIQILHPGLGATLQDRGRPGWRRFGVPTGGAMDHHAAAWANRLLENQPDAPLLELLLQGTRIAVLKDAWFAITGADTAANVPAWRAIRLRRGDSVSFGPNHAGVWIYVAVEGGFAGAHFLGSVSVYSRLSTRFLAAGDILQGQPSREFILPAGVASRVVPPLERRDYSHPPVLRVWPGPQFSQFSNEARAALDNSTWTISSQSDRVGYRLLGNAVPTLAEGNLELSEPVRTGTIQVPENGMPIVTMRDGPTMGGYAKLGVLEPADVSWLAQCRPGQAVRFVWASSAIPMPT